MAVTDTCIADQVKWLRITSRRTECADVREWRGKAASDLRMLNSFLSTLIQPDRSLWASLALMRTLEDENGLELRPTQLAYDKALSFLTFAVARTGVPLPMFTPDGEGGIDIEWEIGSRHLALNCDGQGPGDFVSWREADSRYEGKSATNELLTERLKWLTS